MNTCCVLLVLFAALPLAAAEPADALVEKLLDRIVERERTFLTTIQTRTPLVETYIQETPENSDASARPTKDHYFLGRFRLGDTITYEPLVQRTDAPAPKSNSWLPFRSDASKNQPLTFLPRGFAQMAVIDLRDFNRQTYRFEYVRREFLGDIRCLVFDVAPVNRQQAGKFVGRMWVEDRDDAIVRFNGTYVQAPRAQERSRRTLLSFRQLARERGRGVVGAGADLRRRRSFAGAGKNARHAAFQSADAHLGLRGGAVAQDRRIDQHPD